VKLLLDLGADVNAVDKHGDTAMHGAAYNISPLVVAAAERGADPQVWKNPNKAGGTPVHSRRLHQPSPASRCANDRGHYEAHARRRYFDGERPKIIDSEKPAARSSLPNRRSEVGLPLPPDQMSTG
jgi:hypothetical protein